MELQDRGGKGNAGGGRSGWGVQDAKKKDEKACATWDTTDPTGDETRRMWSRTLPKEVQQLKDLFECDRGLCEGTQNSF